MATVLGMTSPIPAQVGLTVGLYDCSPSFLSVLRLLGRTRSDTRKVVDEELKTKRRRNRRTDDIEKSFDLLADQQHRPSPGGLIGMNELVYTRGPFRMREAKAEEAAGERARGYVTILSSHVLLSSYRTTLQRI